LAVWSKFVPKLERNAVDITSETMQLTSTDDGEFGADERVEPGGAFGKLFSMMGSGI